MRERERESESGRQLTEGARLRDIRLFFSALIAERKLCEKERVSVCVCEWVSDLRPSSVFSPLQTRHTVSVIEWCTSLQTCLV